MNRLEAFLESGLIAQAAYVKHNLRHWRWRHLLLVVLTALTFFVCFLYSSSLSVSWRQGSDSVEALRLPYYDAMVYLDGEAGSQPPILADHLESEGALAGQLYSAYGRIEALALAEPSRSAFFRIEPADLVGRAWQKDGEILLPFDLAEQRGIALDETLILRALTEHALSELSLRVVGFYRSEANLTPALLALSDMRQLLPSDPAAGFHRLLVADRAAAHPLSAADAQSLLRFLQLRYPDATVVGASLPEQLRDQRYTLHYQPSSWLLLLLFFFAGIALFTVILTTLTERRKEVATLKAAGVLKRQLRAYFYAEYGGSLLLGLLCGAAAVILFSEGLLAQSFAGPTWHPLWLQMILALILVFLLVMFYPVGTLLNASVDQLLYQRTLPLFSEEVRGLTRSTRMDEQRQQEENVRLIKLPMDLGEPLCLILRREGDRVRQGETVAVQESWGGLRWQEWTAPCDGIIVSIDAGGYVAIGEEGGGDGTGDVGDGRGRV